MPKSLLSSMLRRCLPLGVAAGLLAAATAAQQPAVVSRVVVPVDSAQRLTLHGSTHPLIRTAADQGVIPSSTPLQRTMLVLQRSSAQQAALESLLAQQQQPGSPHFHQWLTPQAFGAQFGPSDADLAALTGWLSRSGFSGIRINPGRTVVEFSGTEAALEAAFRTSLHSYALNGAVYTANSEDPQIPAALAPILGGFVSLNNFPRHAYNHIVGVFRRDAHTGAVTRLGPGAGVSTLNAASPSFTFTDNGYTDYGITPPDFDTIYDVKPLQSASTPIDGTGQTIAIVGETDINPQDFLSFRTLFGLPLGNTATSTGSQYLNIIYNGPNPGFTGDETEADIDTQWSTAAAPRATIDYVASAGTTTTQGIDLSAQYIVDNNLAPVMSESYGECERYIGTSGNTFFNNLWQQAAAQGITAMVSSGDSGAAGCDGAGSPYAQQGNAVNGLASTPWNIAVGGTDFNLPKGGAAYFSGTNSSTYGSALGYIPEVPWNDSCANSILPEFSLFAGDTPAQVCGLSNVSSYGLLEVVGGGGGASSCTVSDGVNYFTCTGGYPKPAWQSVAGVPADGVRDVPDVSLFASNGFFGAFTVVCEQDADIDGESCNLNSPYYDFVGIGGTSVASPSFAGVMALVNQKTGVRQGNANYVLYNLFNRQVTAGTSCAATGSGASSCLFHDITIGSNSEPCYTGGLNCLSQGFGVGALSGGLAGTGYDTASGLGSVDVANLVNGWSSAALSTTQTSLTLSPASITHGSTVTATVAVTSSAGTPAGNVSVNGLAPNGSVLAGALNSSAGFSAPVETFPGGTYTVTAHYAGSAVFAQSDSPPVTLTVSPEPSTVTVSPLLYSPSGGTFTNAANPLVYGLFNLIGFTVDGSSGQGIATGNLLVQDNGLPFDGGTFPLNSTNTIQDYSPSLTAGTHHFTVSYTGDASFNPAQTAATLTILPASTTMQSTQVFILNGSATFITANLDTNSVGYHSPTGSVALMNGSVLVCNGTLHEFFNPYNGVRYSESTFAIPSGVFPLGISAATLVYGGDVNYAGSSAPVSIDNLTDNLPASTTSLALLSSSIPFGGSLTATATVTPSSTSNVSFLIDNFVYNTLQYTSAAPYVSGTATLSANYPLTPGNHTIQALSYASSYALGSLSPVVSFLVQGATSPSSTTLSLNSSSVAIGQTITATASVLPSSATGTVQLVVDGNNFGLPATLSGGSASLTLTTATFQAGAHTVAVAYSGDATYQPSISASTALTLTAVTQGSFLLSLNSSAVTVTRGTPSAPNTITLTPTGSFNSTVSFSCSGLPSEATCVFSPPSITLNGGSGSTSLTFTATPPTVAGGASQPSWLVPRGVPALFALLGVCLFGRRRKVRLLILPLLLLMALSLLTACGSSSSGSGSGGGGGQSYGGTPTGTYSIVITASSAQATLTSTVTLTVQ